MGTRPIVAALGCALLLALPASAPSAASLTNLAHVGPPSASPPGAGPIGHAAPARGPILGPLAAPQSAGRGTAAVGAAPARSSSSGLPTWNGAFQRNGVSFPFTMIGSDPHQGPATTMVHVLLIPLRFEYPDAALPVFGTTVFDASTDLVDGRLPIDGILSSPLFTPYPFVVGGVKVGTTQFTDAVQRAGWWNDLPPGKNYHVLLAPSVAPVQTIPVPAEEAYYFYDSAAGVNRPALSDAFLQQSLDALVGVLGIPTGVEPIFITGPVETLDAAAAHCCRGGEGVPWIWAPYESIAQ